MRNIHAIDNMFYCYPFQCKIIHKAQTQVYVIKILQPVLKLGLIKDCVQLFILQMI